MKLVVVLAVLGLAFATAADDKYTDKYDSVDVQEIISNKRLFVAYIKCMIDEGPCTPEGAEVKSHLKESVETKCAKCTDKQKEMAKVVTRTIYKDYPEYHDKLRKAYDSDGKYGGDWLKDMGEQ